MRRALSLTCALLVSGLAVSQATAAIEVEFSGGNGQPLTITLPTATQYVVDQQPGDDGVSFLLRDIGKVFDNLATGDVTFSVNGGPAYDTGYLGSGYVGQDQNPQDGYLTGDAAALQVGDVVTLSAGTLTTIKDYAGPAPVSGLYGTVLADGFGTAISGAGESVATSPEPAALALVGMAGLAGLKRVRR